VVDIPAKSENGEEHHPFLTGNSGGLGVDPVSVNTAINVFEDLL